MVEGCHEPVIHENSDCPISIDRSNSSIFIEVGVVECTSDFIACILQSGLCIIKERLTLPEALCVVCDGIVSKPASIFICHYRIIEQLKLWRYHITGKLAGSIEPGYRPIQIVTLSGHIVELDLIPKCYGFLE